MTLLNFLRLVPSRFVIVTGRTLTAHFSLDYIGFRCSAASRIRLRVSSDKLFPLLMLATCCRRSSE